METLELTNVLIGTPVSVGLYESRLGNLPDQDLEYVLEGVETETAQDITGKILCDHYSHGHYKLAVLNAVREYLTTHLNPHLIGKFGIEAIEYKEIHSPRQYNYGTDELYIDFKMKECYADIITAFAEGAADDLDEFLENTNKSYEGFSSLMPQSTDELLEGLEDDPERSVAALIDFYLQERTDFYETDHNEVFLEKFEQDFSIYDVLEPEGIELLNKERGE